MPATKTERLTDTSIAKLAWKSKLFYLPAGRGLQLAVYPRGRKTWQLRARIAGKAAVLTLGYWPEMSCHAARQRVRLTRKHIASGDDPRQTRQILAAMTVNAFAKKWLADVVAVRRKNPRQVERSLSRDILPWIGSMRIEKVTAADVRRVVYRRRDENRPAAALRIRGTLDRLFNYARDCGFVAANPVTAIDKRYLGRLASRTRALPATELKLFFAGLKRMSFRNQAALELILLTLCRKGELLGARWKHIDFAAGTWEVPAELSKSGLPHVVYLPPRALELFVALWPLDGERPDATHAHSGTRRVDPEEYALPHQNSRTQPQEPTTLNKALLRVNWGIPHFTVHDLRRTASTHLNEMGYNPDVIEKALNHAVRGGVRGIYNRAQYAAERKKMLEAWSKWLEGLKD